MDITVIIPFNKNRGFLGEAVKSAETQTFSGSVQILKWFGLNSVAKNINMALEVAEGRYIKLCAEDDLLTPNCLNDLYTKIEQGFDMVCANAINRDKEDDIEFKSEVPFDLFTLSKYNSIHGLTVLYKKEALDFIKEEYGYYLDESIDCAEEYDLHLRLLKHGAKIGYVNSVVGIYRIHANQKSLGANINKGERIHQRFDTIQKIKTKYL